MRRFSIALLLVILAVSPVHSADKPAPPTKPAKPTKPAAAPPAPARLFSDKHLESAVREDLKKGEKEEIKEEDLKNLSFLHGDHKKIKSLSGLDKCVNLASIDLAGNEISDVKPLSGLVNVQTLDLNHNRIVDVAPLAPLEKL